MPKPNTIPQHSPIEKGRISSPRLDVLPFRCLVRERLRAAFMLRLETYNREWSEICDLEGAQAATEKQYVAFDDCVKARLSLERHESSHGCCRASVNERSDAAR